ncbi:MAG: rod shape-determining protein MreD [Candidatus Neomarinimicrobiota bacterium]
MVQALKITGVFVGVMLAQLYLAQWLEIGDLRPDFILIFLVYISARYGRIAGILWGFGAGFLQDLTGSLSVLGANALAKSVVGYILGTLNGTLTVWTPRIVNLYIYGTLVGHAVIYQLVMSWGLEIAPGLLISRILLEAFISSVIVTGMRFVLPLMPSQA